MGKKFYYLIEDIDINGDTNPDGFLITKYKINKKTLDKIFIKSKYVSFEKFNNKINDINNFSKSKIGGVNQVPPHYYNNVPYMNNNEFNKVMNNPYHNPYNTNQHPQVMVAYHQPNMGNAFMEGLGGGLGAGLGLGIMDGLFELF